ncbi:hypothetical protein pmac_cds_66 [Pandoravirus macleodensis]|uniref:Uncharacterized protein n=1 Tax=Pandoravirus macleodensis TaxID=2107707 RepID=A0A2U7UE88_9VIRU|nr:hypothetical protein pmac_cds_66 [Pandoravirus macleodensis]AVK76754.1 hypothetical protein pmac_cds_66 [Pandoravirus macleodensis]
MEQQQQQTPAASQALTQRQPPQPPAGPLSLMPPPPQPGRGVVDTTNAAPAAVAAASVMRTPGVPYASGMVSDGIPSVPVLPRPLGPYDDTILPAELRRFAVVAAVVLFITVALCFWASSVATSRCRVRYGGPLGVPEGPVTRVVESLRSNIVAVTRAID